MQFSTGDRLWETWPVMNYRLLVLFDLDGTLVDPAGAITGGITASLQAHGLPEASEDQLRAMVGPPLVTSLREIAGVPEQLLDPVIAHYREGYRRHGMAGSRPYPGVIEVVERLRAAGHLVAVATQKPQGLAGELLRVQQMDGLFESINGSPDEEQAPGPDGKTPIIAAALARHEGRYDDAVMVGDRSHDISGAAANGLDCIPVGWGFGSPEEFSAAGATETAETAEALLDLILARVPQEVRHGHL
ncbi:HAD family hydrolase [Arthrobacter sp. AET 35A]|uniref:HAD hydrolase-like protein n=2 Tax=unclassified Arthrobacter TaxID=235627 RepID=UPI0014912C90|nr:HAD hydrolase-like protein [Arthrobacter sp. 147(2020)]MBE0010679.1 HAD family hydrolase [Arthrobacter sp. AET 35A]